MAIARRSKELRVLVLCLDGQRPVGNIRGMADDQAPQQKILHAHLIT
jgi:hypothetical protein